MTLFIVKIAPKQRSIHEKFLGIVGKLSLIRENTCQSSSLSSDTNQPTPITLSIHVCSTSQAIQTNDQYKISSHRTDRAN